MVRGGFRSSAGALALVSVLAAACTAGRVETGMDGAVSRTDGAPGRLDGETDRDGSALADGAVRDGALRDGAISPDGSTSDGGGVARRESDCLDGLDGDGDGATDCEDPDCDAVTCDGTGRRCLDGTCGGCTGATNETSCGDGRDEDCDTLTDCADPDCDGTVCGPGGVTCADDVCPCASGFEELLCGDGTDDDCDGTVDCEDSDCVGRLCSDAGHVCLGGACLCPGEGFPELCEGTDENCSGVVDESCPNAISFCCAMSLFPVGGTIGTAWADECPTGAALVGVAGRASTRLDALQPICSALIFEVDEDTRPEHTFSVRRGAPIDRAVHGGSGGTAFEDLCPANEVVLGVRGSATETGVDSISLQCGSLSIHRTGGFDWALTVTPTGTTPLRGVGSGGEDAYTSDCPARSVITGLSGRADTRVGQLGVSCRRVDVSLR